MSLSGSGNFHNQDSNSTLPESKSRELTLVPVGLVRTATSCTHTPESFVRTDELVIRYKLEGH
jgi:hypothetical protein